MRWTDDRLSELLGSLPPPPEHLVELVKELPLHFGGAPAVGNDEPDDGGAQVFDDSAPAAGDGIDLIGHPPADDDYDEPSQEL